MLITTEMKTALKDFLIESLKTPDSKITPIIQKMLSQTKRNSPDIKSAIETLKTMQKNNKDKKEASENLINTLLANCAQRGIGFSEAEKNLAFELCKTACEQKYPLAQYVMARCLAYANGCKQDVTASFECYKAATKNGILSAQTELVFIFENSKKYKDPIKAGKLKAIAASRATAIESTLAQAEKVKNEEQAKSLSPQLAVLKVDLTKIEQEIRACGNINDDNYNFYNNIRELLEFKILHIEGKLSKLTKPSFIAKTASGSASASTGANKNTNAKVFAEQYYLYACGINIDGIGDLGHFIDIAREHGKDDGLEELKPLFLIIYSEYTTSSEKIKQILKSEGFNTEGDNLHVCSREQFATYFNKSTTLKNQLLKTKAMLSISLYDFDLNAIYPTKEAKHVLELFKKHNKTIPCLNTAEHQADRRFEIEELSTFSMGIGSNYVKDGHPRLGFLIKKQPKKTIGERCKILAEIKDKVFLDALLRTKTPEKLLKSTLIIPGYYQDKPETFLPFINIIADSPIASTYREIVFILNTGCVYPNIAEYDYILSNNIQELSVLSKNGNEVQERSVKKMNKKSKGLSIRILEGFWLDADDYNRLHQCAAFGIFSGDKSLEKVFSYGLNPMGQIRGWKGHLFASLKRYVEAVLAIEAGEREKNLVLECLNLLWRGSDPKYATELVKNITPEFERLWGIVNESLFDNYNYYSKLPAIKKYSLELAKKAIPTPYYDIAETVFDETGIQSRGTKLVMGYLYDTKIKEYESMSKVIERRVRYQI